MDKEKFQRANELDAEIKASKAAVTQMKELLSMGLVKPDDVVECFLDSMPEEHVRRLSALAIGMVQERKDFLEAKIEKLNKEFDEL